MLKTIYKMTKMGFIFAREPRECDVARKATWQRHASPRGASAVRCDVCIIYIYRKYNVYSIGLWGR